MAHENTDRAECVVLTKHDVVRRNDEVKTHSSCDSKPFVGRLEFDPAFYPVCWQKPFVDPSHSNNV